jgi:hypothetical protein
MFYLALLASQASSTSIISPISQGRLVTPAAIAGVVRSVLWMRNAIVVHREQCDGMGVVLDFL